MVVDPLHLLVVIGYSSNQKGATVPRVLTAVTCSPGTFQPGWACPSGGRGRLHPVCPRNHAGGGPGLSLLCGIWSRPGPGGGLTCTWAFFSCSRPGHSACPELRTRLSLQRDLESPWPRILPYQRHSRVCESHGMKGHAPQRGACGAEWVCWHRASSRALSWCVKGVYTDLPGLAVRLL